MTPAELDSLLALADAATPGSWWHEAGGWIQTEGQDEPVAKALGPRGPQKDADAAFIAAANPDTIRALVAGFADTLDEVARLSQIERTARHMAVFDQPDGSSAEDAMAQLRAALEPKP